MSSYYKTVLVTTKNINRYNENLNNYTTQCTVIHSSFSFLIKCRLQNLIFIKSLCTCSSKFKSSPIFYPKKCVPFSFSICVTDSLIKDTNSKEFPDELRSWNSAWRYLAPLNYRKNLKNSVCGWSSQWAKGELIIYTVTSQWKYKGNHLLNWAYQ